MIAVSDTGEGMDAQTLAQAIEPFFTTKEVGRGTGLGLSMVYGFIKQSGGHMRIQSQPGQGTSVRLYLPRHHGSVAANDAQDVAPTPSRGGAETILLCEDDDNVRAYSFEVLRDLGYDVIAASDGPASLAALEAADRPVDLLFTDVVLPGGMTGADLGRAARQRWPGLKILFTTGYDRDAIVHHGRLDAGVDLLTKPFGYADLAAKIRDVLDRAEERTEGVA
jgi:CheY-like chemotaxis protein